MCTYICVLMLFGVLGKWFRVHITTVVGIGLKIFLQHSIVQSHRVTELYDFCTVSRTGPLYLLWLYLATKETRILWVNNE